ncbi:hypothetical protein OKW40_002428 [Paraburkholderia sp. RAU6.4a]|uniref:hypothetical protein n=1 Tax=Paraburkholderia sp. RAU6.4a TaxID=2991067 RepID=UPI003D1CC5FD
MKLNDAELSLKPDTGRFAWWKVLAPVLGAATLYFAYLVGVTFHQTFLERFGVNPGAFPQGRSDYLVLAVLAVMKDLDIILGATFKSKPVLVVIGALLIAGILALALGQGAAKLGKLHRGRAPVSTRVKLLATYLLLFPLGGAYLMFAVPVSFATVLIFPVELGVAAANALANDDITDYVKGCSAHAHGQHCFQLMDGTSVIATGFIIEQSKDAVAIWENGKVKLLPLTNRSLESVDQFISTSH